MKTEGQTENNKMVVLNPNILIFILNINGLNIIIKQQLSDSIIIILRI